MGRGETGGPSANGSRWRALAAVSIGTSHQRAGLPCQDAAEWRLTSDGTLLAAAADGAGTAERAEAGARLAVQTALDYLEAALEGWTDPYAPSIAGLQAERIELRLDPNTQADLTPPPALPEESPTDPNPLATAETMMAAAESMTLEPSEADPQSTEPEPSSSASAGSPAPLDPNPAADARAARLLSAFACARLALERLADGEARPLRDFSATLTLAVAGTDYLAAGAVGDCAVVAGGANGDGSTSEAQDELFTVLPLQRGEYANETDFITAANALQQARIVVLERRVSRLALFSDGLARLALQWPEQTPHRPFFAPLFTFTAGLPPAPLPEQSRAPAYAALEDNPLPAAVAGQTPATQLADFLGSARVNARTDDDKALILAVGG